MSAPADRRFAARFVVALAVYAVLLIAGILIANALPGSFWRFLAMALPVPALLLVVRAVAKQIRESDEFQARATIESLAVGFAGGSLTTFTYGLFQVVGAPAANWMLVWAVYAAWWIIGRAVVWKKYQ